MTMTMPLSLMASDASASHFPISATLTLLIGFSAAAAFGSVAWFRSRRPIGWKGVKNSGATSKPDAGYDRGIVPAETAARQRREGQVFKETPVSEGHSDITAGYTTDREGLINNYAIEPEMYIEEPGDLRQEQEAQKQQRAQELHELNDPNGEVKVKGPGVI